MLLPSSIMNKYVKMVMGLLLIAIILSPILKFLSTDFETLMEAAPDWDRGIEEKMENSIEMQKKEIQASQYAYILEETTAKLRESAEEELIGEYGLQIDKVEFSMDEKDFFFPENLKTITVYLKKQEEKAEAEAVALVKKIEINTKSPPSANEFTRDSRKIASFLAEKWGVEEELIEIVVEGGDK